MGRSLVGRKWVETRSEGTEFLSLTLSCVLFSGVVQQVKPIIGPMDLVLHVAVNYVKSGLISHFNIVVIRIFISDWSL